MIDNLFGDHRQRDSHQQFNLFLKKKDTSSKDYIFLFFFCIMKGEELRVVEINHEEFNLIETGLVF